MSFSGQEIAELPNILSLARFSTYLNAKAGSTPDALALYEWNINVSCAFLAPLQIFEVAMRNTISEAIELNYGPNWPFEPSFEIGLPNPRNAYSPRRDMIVHRRLETTGKIIAELKFMFWQQMFTARYDSAIWNHHLRTVFPQSDKTKSIKELRAEARGIFEDIRKLRNRIAHHEPIFSRNLILHMDQIKKLLKWRSGAAVSWVDRIEEVSNLVATKP